VHDFERERETQPRSQDPGPRSPSRRLLSPSLSRRAATGRKQQQAQLRPSPRTGVRSSRSFPLLFCGGRHKPSPTVPSPGATFILPHGLCCCRTVVLASNPACLLPFSRVPFCAQSNPVLTSFPSIQFVVVREVNLAKGAEIFFGILQLKLAPRVERA
jgi:hypothetical protein